MASQVALFTGLSGLNANARTLDVIGNNIANVNTTGFKSTRLNFQNVFSRTVGIGSAPSTELGGTNPYQVGLGVGIAGTQRDMSGGTVTATGNSTDLAIEGEGFFVVDRGGRQAFTRAGTFQRDASNMLTTIGGDRVRGFGVDEDFTIIPGSLTDISIPIGALTIAQASTRVDFTGNLNAGGDAATTGSSTSLLSGVDAGFSLITGATVPPTAPNVLEPASLLTEIAAAGSSTTPMFAAGQTLRLTGARKGTTTLPTANLAITPTTTVQNLMSFLSAALGIDTSLTNPAGPAPGVALDPTTGRISVTGNIGRENDIDLDSSDLRLLDSGGSVIGQPILSQKDADATGESVRTTFLAYDSLGQQYQLDLTMVLESKSNAGTTWRWFSESRDAAGGTPLIGTGVTTFDSFGRLTAGGAIPLQINRAGTGAVTPAALTLNLANGADAVSALADVTSTLASANQDGAPTGTLESFGIGTDGVITGTFSNGLTRALGQVAVATFANPAGLVDDGSNLFSVGANSGNAVIAAPQTGQAGRILGGTLELSNVDLGKEFTNLILATTGYSASSRVIRTADELMQQLLVLGR